MIGRRIGGVDIANTVGEDGDAVPLISTQNGPRCTRREARRRNAGQASEDIAQLRARFVSEHFAGNR